MRRVIVTAILTAVVTSMFWMWFYGSVVSTARAPDGAVVSASDVVKGVEVGPAGLAIPVAGIKAGQLADTYSQARAGGARRHDAIDIMAAEGSPVVAAADGAVEKLFNSAEGGLTMYVRSPDRRWTYYYAHLHSYAPGLAEGQRVRRGQMIGRVGHTGNANPAGPHLHFAINRMTPQERWWHGAPVNPYPLLARKKASG